MTQQEFELQLQALKEDYQEAVHPVLDEQRNNIKERTRLEAKITFIRGQIEQLKIEYLELEQKRKDIARNYSRLDGELKKEYLREELARNTEPACQPREQE